MTTMDTLTPTRRATATDTRGVFMKPTIAAPRGSDGALQVMKYRRR